jgi:hypothetical protein
MLIRGQKWKHSWRGYDELGEDVFLHVNFGAKLFDAVVRFQPGFPSTA